MGEHFSDIFTSVFPSGVQISSYMHIYLLLKRRNSKMISSDFIANRATRKTKYETWLSARYLQSLVDRNNIESFFPSVCDTS